MLLATAAQVPPAFSITLGAVLVLFGIRALMRWNNPAYSRLAISCTVLLLGFLLTGAVIPHLKRHGISPTVNALIGLWVIAVVMACAAVGILALVFLYRRPKAERPRGLVATWVSLIVLTACITWGIVLVVSRNNGEQIMGSQAEEVVISDFDYSITRPGGWVSMDPKVFNPDSPATTFLRRPAKDIWFSIVPESIEPGSLTLEMGISVVKSNVAANCTDMGKWLEEDCEANGLKWRRLSVDGNIASQRIQYVIYAAIQDGFMYQLTTWGPAGVKDEIFKNAKDFLHSFRKLNSPLARQQPKLPDFNSTKFEYKVRLFDSAWKPYKNLAKDYPAAEFGVIGNPDRALLVIPMPMGELRPEMPALVRALLSKIGASTENFEVTAKRSPQWGEEWVLEGTRLLASGTFRYVCRAAHNPPLSVLVAAWSADGSAKALELIREDVDRVTLPELPPDKLTPQKGREFALFANELGLYYYAQDQFDRAGECFKVATEEAPDSAIMLGNLCDAYLKLRQPERALKALEIGEERVSKSAPMLALSARVHAAANDPEKAMVCWRKAFELKLSDTDSIRDFISFSIDLADDAAAEEAVHLVEPYVSTTEANALTRGYVRLIKRAKGLDAALAYVDNNRWAEEGDSSAMRWQILYDAKEYTRALDLCDQLIQKNADTWKPHWRRAHTLWSLRRLREAKAEFQKVLDLNPLHEDSKNSISELAGLLGQGDNSSVSTAIPAVELPLHARDALDAPLPQSPNGSDAAYGARISAVEFSPGKPGKTSRYSRVKVFNSAGATEFNTVTLGFDSFNERVYVNELKVYGPDGSLVGSGDPESYYVTHDSTDRTASNSSKLNIPIPGLRPGGSFLLVTTEEETAARDRLDFCQHTFGSYYPATNDIFMFRAGKVEFAERTSPGVTKESGDGYTMWSRKNCGAFRWESEMPDLDSVLPTLFVGPKSESWTKLSKDYISRISERIQPNAAIKRKVAELKEGSTGKADLLRRIVRFVQENVSYTAIEFGIRGRIPEPAARVLENRYGDCKDHAGLLYALLTAAGIEAELTLVNTGRTAIEEIPSLDQFDHMIVHVPDAPGKFIDCTEKNAEATILPPYCGLGRRVLILGTTARFASVELPEGVDNSMDIRRSILERRPEEIVVEEEATFKAYLAADMRRYLKSQPEADRKNRIEKYLSGGGLRVRVERFDYSDVNAVSEPITLKLAYTLVPPPGQGENSEYLPCIWERNYMVDWEGERRTPFERKYPLHIRTAISWPPASKAPLNPTPKSSKKAVDWKVDGALAGGMRRLTSQVEVKSGRLEPKLYQAYIDDTESLLRFLEHPVATK